VLPYRVLVGREIHAIHLILRHIAVQPLNLGPQRLQGLQRTQGQFAQLSVRQRPRAPNFTFDYKLRHKREQFTTDTGAFPAWSISPIATLDTEFPILGTVARLKIGFSHPTSAASLTVQRDCKSCTVKAFRVCSSGRLVSLLFAFRYKIYFIDREHLCLCEHHRLFQYLSPDHSNRAQYKH
jgi:hypothetical protein